MTPEQLRAALPATRDHCFLNYAATAPVLAPSADTQARLAREGTAPLGGHFTAWLAELEATRGAVAALVGATPEEVAFTTNTSMALSLAAAAVRWRPGDRVLYPADEFPSNRYVWQNLADLGVLAEPISVPPDASLPEALAGMRLERVRLVAFSAVSYRDGRFHDPVAVAAVCRPRGVLTVVDAIQAVGAIPVDFKRWDSDFLACGGQKWLLGPLGTGFLVLRRALLDELHVPLVGWASSRYAGDTDAPELAFCAGARRFEPGLPDVPALAALGTSIGLLGEAGWPLVFTRVAQLNRRIKAQCRDMGYEVVTRGPAETPTGIATIRLANAAAAEDLFHHFEAKRIVVTQRGDEVRLAAHVTTSDDDVDAALAVLAAASVAGRPARTAAGPSPSPSPGDGSEDGADAAAPSTRGAADRGRLRTWRYAPAAGAGRGLGAPFFRGNGDRRRPPPWRLALVTGASHGLGAAVAEALARRGCELVLVGRDGAALEALADRLATEYGTRAEPTVLDLADPLAVGGWLTQHQARLARCDVLANCAAAATADLALEVALADWRAGMEVGFWSPVRLAQALIPGMVEREAGAVLNVVTTGARNALPLFAPYASTKGALWSWSEALTRELAGTGVTVTTILPPAMDTRTARHLGRQALAYYDAALARRLGRSSGPSPRAVAERAVASLAAGRTVVVPWRARLDGALNALWPELVTRRVARLWRGRPAARK